MRKLRLMFGRAIEYFHKFGFREFIKRVFTKLFHLDEVNYQKWFEKKAPSVSRVQYQRQVKFEYEPLFSIVVPLYRTPPKYLEAMIDSVRTQSYGKWELCLSDGSGKNSSLKTLLLQYEKLDARIKVIYNNASLKISDNTNVALKSSKGDYIVFMDHDDLLTPDALFECVAALNCRGKQDILYTDEDKITMNGKKVFQPHFKSDFNIDLLCSMNYICHLFIVSRELYESVGLLRSEFDGAQDYDYILRCAEIAKNIYHIPKVLYHWRAHKDSTAGNQDSKFYAIESGRQALQCHYERIGLDVKVRPGEEFGTYRSYYKMKKKPLISIIIPNKDHIADLQQCIHSIETKSEYSNYEYIIIENNSELEETFAYYTHLMQENTKVKVITWSGDFNYAAINNYGVTFASGEYYLFLNNDTEIINNECLEELIGYCMREDVGIVGARLYYPDNIIQHAGIVIGYGEIAGHAFIGQLRGEPGYFSRIQCAQDYSAVTAACMMVKKNVFQEVGGFDELYAVALNDVDFCMKVRKNGKLVVYNPYAELYHYESKSRGLEDTKKRIERFENEKSRFREKWKDILDSGDPYYNSNLTLKKPDFSLKPFNE